MKLVYIFDAYCGWSYGFARTMADVARRHPELPVEVVSGGLFIGGRRVPIRQFGYLQGANAEITKRTGAPFGESYERLVSDGGFVMDSEAAACGMAALRDVAPENAVRIAALLQEAFYIDGLSLSEVSTYRIVAQRAGLDGDAVEAALDRVSAADDFLRARELGVTGYPTLLADYGDRVVTLVSGNASADEVERRIGALVTS